MRAWSALGVALALAATGCGSDGLGDRPSAEANKAPPSTATGVRLEVAEIARVRTPHASFVSVAAPWVAWASAAARYGKPDRVVVYNVETGEQRSVVDLSQAGGLADRAKLSGDLLVHGEQYPVAGSGPEVTNVAGPWRIVTTDLTDGTSTTIASDGGDPDLQDINVNFDVDDQRILWVTPAGVTPEGFPQWSLHVAGLDGSGKRTVGPPREYASAILAGGRILVVAPSSPTTGDVFEVDEGDGTLRQLTTTTGNINRVAPGNDEFFVAEVNRDARLHLVRVPLDRPDDASDFGGQSSNVAVGDHFALWYPWGGDAVVLAPLANTRAQISPVPRGRPDVPTRTAAHGELAVWGEETGPEAADDVEIVVARVSVR